MHLEILDKKRIELFQKLSWLNNYGFYLAGGTALALHFSHRTSVDFDFYTKENFNQEELIKELKKIGKIINIFLVEKNTLGAIIDNIEVTFFKYDYDLIGKFSVLENIKIASVKDIAAMKVVAIVQRGTQRDFIDIFYLSKKFGLKKIINWTQKKYPEYSIPLCLKALTYFDDAIENDENKQRIKVFDKNFNWSQAKKYIEEEVFKYQN